LHDDGTWHLPRSRTKNKLPHVVPLCLPATALIGSVPIIEGSTLVFSTTGLRPVSGWSKTKARLDAAMRLLAKEETIAPWTLHDLRRTAVTGMANLGIAPHVVEAVVNHISGAKAGVAGTYNRAEYLPERKAALERWATHVQGLLGHKLSNVVDMPRKKGKRP
jgi:integrase